MRYGRVCCRLLTPLLLLTASALAVVVPVDRRFDFDGQHSDFAQQFYRRHVAGDAVDQMKHRQSDLPNEVQDELHQYKLRWGQLPGLLQRAVLWDMGYVVALDDKITRIYTRCGRSMAQIFVSRKAYERIGCTPKACSVPTGELSYRHKWCDGDQATHISLCAAEDADLQGHSAMWGDGADDDFIPEVNLVRHSWTDHNDSYLVYALHTQVEEVAYNFCPTRPTPIIPCAAYANEDKSRWCRPVRGKIVTPWLQNFAIEHEPSHVGLVLAVIGSVIVIGGVSSLLWKWWVGGAKETEAQKDLGEALLVSIRSVSTSSYVFDADQNELEQALDVAAHEHFDSSIGFSASAHTSHSSRSSLKRRLSSLEDPQSSEPMPRTFERSISISSSIRMLSERRSQVTIRSFRLFESHHVIREKRVPFREIQFHRALSEGTTGEVWLATLRGRQVAVKQLLSTKRRVLKEMEMFMAEIYLLTQLQHPNIIALVGVAWNTLEHVVMVQEWMERGDLQHFLQRQLACAHPEFTWTHHKLAISLSVARALAYMHSLTPQLLHRDVKSKNVLLSNAMEVKLCDFGISRRKHSMDEDDTNLTITEAAGTMSWTAPELLLGEDYDEKIDIYSFGVLLCEVDTCLLPYHDAEALASRLIFHPLRLMRLVVHEGRRPHLSSSCPALIKKLAHVCLDRDPAKRPSAHAIVTLLTTEEVV